MLIYSLVDKIEYCPLSQGIFISYLFMWEPLKYGEDIEYPFYMHAIGFVMSLASMLWIPGYAIYYVISQRGSFRDVSKGTDYWKFIARIALMAQITVADRIVFTGVARIRGSVFT